jgi:trimeric autotransporter adhesin
MLLRRTYNMPRLLCILAWLSTAMFAAASEHHGQVTFNSLPLPGATVTATRGTDKLATITDSRGVYSFPDLKDGAWTMEAEKLFFVPLKQEVVVSRDAPAATWELKLLPLYEIKAQAKLQTSTPAVAIPTQNNGEAAKPQEKSVASSPSAEPAKPQEESDQRASDGLLINGSVNNAASSPFALSHAFGNTRNSGKGLYNAGLALILDNSALDARPYSLSGLEIPKPAYNQVTGVATLGGPIRIPHLLWHGPNFFVGYQWMRSQTSTALPGLVPDMAERNGDFSDVLNAQGEPVQIFDPATGLLFPGNVAPISPQAQALLNLYPLPNVTGNSGYNYQIPVLASTHQDSLQARLDKSIGAKNQLFGRFAFQSTRSGNTNLFGFLDRTDALGINSDVNWTHRISHEMLMTTGYRFSRLRTGVTPYFENRHNVSGAAGINGNDQDPADWGPPSLTFASGIAGLSDIQSSLNRNETNAVSYSMNWNHLRHYWTLGGDFRRQEFNYLTQQNPRGTFTFTGAATQGMVNSVPAGGSDFADFLLGIPDTSAIAYGNADKYFRESVYDAYATDDFRVSPELTINAGVRWEYGAPITELFGRLVNLDVSDGFAAVAPVVASDPTGPLTRQRYPDSLIRPDKRLVEPRIGISWRPISGSSIVARAGYGIYSDTSVYQSTALSMAQQAPLSKSLSVQNSTACPLTLANGFNPCSSTTSDTFAVDPNFRVGYAQVWQLSVQSDLPAALQLTATYLGIKGTRGVQEFLPNTYPIGAVNPCPGCPIGFAYRTSNGDSTRESGMIQLRRRLRRGITASLQYTYAKSLDDDSVLGGQGPVAAGSTSPTSTQAAPVIAQNWLNLKAERGLSTFDQRNLLNLQLQYTSGMGLRGGTLMNGWRGALLKEWTILSTIAAGTGLPETPIYLAAVPGTGLTGTIRPDFTGKSVSAAPSDLHLNPAAYSTPALGQWGTAGRDSITGPGQFSLNGSMSRTFRLASRFDSKLNLDARIDGTNLLNHGVFTAWNTTINSTQFGLPAAANPMRSLQATLRLRF